VKISKKEETIVQAKIVNFGFLESLFEKQKNNILVKLNAP
jgi:hypothetical protein